MILLRHTPFLWFFHGKKSRKNGPAPPKAPRKSSRRKTKKRARPNGRAQYQLGCDPGSSPASAKFKIIREKIDRRGPGGPQSETFFINIKPKPKTKILKPETWNVKPGKRAQQAGRKPASEARRAPKARVGERSEPGSRAFGDLGGSTPKFCNFGTNFMIWGFFADSGVTLWDFGARLADFWPFQPIFGQFQPILANSGQFWAIFRDPDTRSSRPR